MSLKKIVKDIKTVKIQGAQKIAFAALEALNTVVHTSKATTAKQLYKELFDAKKQLDSARATEPLLRNYTTIVLEHADPSNLRKLRETTLECISKLRKDHKTNLRDLIDIGQKKIKKGMTIFTHCHSSSSTGIIISAHKKKKNIQVANTEARPIYQGRITAKELSKAGIKVNHFVDSAALLALEHADIMIIGADAITPNGVINKIGSNMFAQMAKSMHVPVYIATHALKYDPHTSKTKKEKIEERAAKEVWDKPPRKTKVHNPAFELIPPKNFDGIISELGIFDHKHFVKEVKRHYPWIFR